MISVATKDLDPRRPSSSSRAQRTKGLYTLAFAYDPAISTYYYYYDYDYDYDYYYYYYYYYYPNYSKYSNYAND